VKGEAKYIIEYKALNNGVYQFEYQIDQAFLSSFEHSEVKNGMLTAHVIMRKSTAMLHLAIKIEGEAEVECDICLEKFFIPVSHETELTVKFGTENSDLSDADTEITLSESETELVLDKHFFDYINLSIPTRKTHPEDEHGTYTCNPEMLSLLENLNADNEAEQTSDPRWDALKTLMN